MMFFDKLTEVIALSGSISAIIIAGLAVFLTAKMSRRSISRYDDEKREVELSLMRASFERRIADLTSDMLATEQRWRDANHLLIEAQRESVPVSNGSINPNVFFEQFGVRNKTIKVDKKLIFVLTPFSDEEDEVFQNIKDACSKAGFRCVRGDEENATGNVLRHIIKTIAQSRLVIANISSRNPNVFYELGIAQALGKPTILVGKTASDAPFDIAGQRIVLFADPSELQDRISRALIGVFAGQSST